MTIRESRKSRGMTQHELAKRLKVTQSAVARWESGKYPPLRKYHRDLAKALGVTESDLDELKEP